MAVLLIVIFIGFLNHFRIMYFEKPGTPDESFRSAHGAWCRCGLR